MRYTAGGFTIDTGKGLRLSSNGICYADMPYVYYIAGRDNSADGEEWHAQFGPADAKTECSEDHMLIDGIFQGGRMSIRQHFFSEGKSLCESITLTNISSKTIILDTLKLGFAADMKGHDDWRLCAVPFRVQLDGSVHDYSMEMLRRGEYANSVHETIYPCMPELDEKNILRSEAWALGSDTGILIIKYANIVAEMSVVRPERSDDAHTMIYGGAGFCLYGEPSGAKTLKAGASYTFAPTVYICYENGLNNAFCSYRSYIENKGHGLPADYDPPVNWNVLYDTGWHHSDARALKRNYTREVLLEQAGYAKDAGCELLYLDPGWETAEGLTIWDEERLGPIDEMVHTLKNEYGLGLGYRTILFAHHRHRLSELWPEKYLAVRMCDTGTGIEGLCAVNDSLIDEKLARISDITEHGIRFMMFDEMDWCGPCHSSEHSHMKPTVPTDHINAVYTLIAKVKRKFPDLLIEAHDPVWPWRGCNYLPTYFRQGKPDIGCYDENWGFEFMWDCINDLKTGKALSLYYYNLGSSIPLYLHITMAADNDNCLFFWWAASTVRHLGIGGRTGHETINPPDLPEYDKEKRFRSYAEQLKKYRRLKPYFARGIFTGIAENIHLHTLPGSRGGVVNLFNLTDDVLKFDFSVPLDLICGRSDVISGAEGKISGNRLMLTGELQPMSPGLVLIGDAGHSGTDIF